MFFRSNNLYAKLGIAPDSPPNVIRIAYRTLAKTYHPNGTAQSEAIEQAFAEIAAAAAILRDPEKRKLYDRGEMDDSGEETSVGLQRRKRRQLYRASGSVFVLSLLVTCGAVFWGLAPVHLEKSLADKPLQHTSDQVKNSVQDNQSSSGDSVGEESGGDAASGKVTSTQEAPHESNVKPSGNDSSTANKFADQENSYLPPPNFVRHENASETSSAGATKFNPSRNQKEERLPRRHTLSGKLEEGEKSSPKSAQLNTPSEGQFHQLRAFPSDEDIDFKSQRSQKNEENAPSMLKTAACLACLTNAQADCLKACP